jgi:LmbE family N-acetylglucosaminyl deacetylase
MDILAAFAHPDDETRFLGGTLAMLASKGVRVHLVIATRGEGGEVGEPPLCKQEDLGSVREDEMKCAAKALGAASLTFLNYVDPVVGHNEEVFAFKADMDTLSTQLIAKAKKVQADVIISHGSNGEYGHPAHKLMNQAVMAGVQQDRNLNLYTISAFYEDHPRPRLANKDDLADFILDITPWYSAKIEATICHRTQHALFVRRSSKAAGRQMSLAEVTYHEESLRCAQPRGKSNNQDRLAHFLQKECSEALIE